MAPAASCRARTQLLKSTTLIQRSRGNGPVKLQQPPDRVGQVLIPSVGVLVDEGMVNTVREFPE